MRALLVFLVTTLIMATAGALWGLFMSLFFTGGTGSLVAYGAVVWAGYSIISDTIRSHER